MSLEVEGARILDIHETCVFVVRVVIKPHPVKSLIILVQQRNSSETMYPAEQYRPFTTIRPFVLVSNYQWPAHHLISLRAGTFEWKHSTISGTTT